MIRRWLASRQPSTVDCDRLGHDYSIIEETSELAWIQAPYVREGNANTNYDYHIQHYSHQGIVEQTVYECRDCGRRKEETEPTHAKDHDTGHYVPYDEYNAMVEDELAEKQSGGDDDGE